MRSLVVATLVLFSGCQTQFVGSAHIDASACAGTCAASNLQMAGMVYLGEYSSACVCEIPRPAAAPAAPASPAAMGAVGAAVGVVMQQRRAQQDQQNQNATMQRAALH